MNTDTPAFPLQCWTSNTIRQFINMTAVLATRSPYLTFEETGQIRSGKSGVSVYGPWDHLVASVWLPTLRMDPPSHSTAPRSENDKSKSMDSPTGSSPASLAVTTTEGDNLHPEDPLARISSGKNPAQQCYTNSISALAKL